MKDILFVLGLPFVSVLVLAAVVFQVFKVKCPKCGSTDVRDVSNNGISDYKHVECQNCYCRWNLND